MAHYLLRWQLKDTTAQALIGKPQGPYAACRRR